MKKVLALVLAVMMLSTLAFADNITTGAGYGDGTGALKPGAKIKLERGINEYGNLVIYAGDEAPAGVTGKVTYENVYYRLMKDLNSDNYKLSKRITKGKDLIEDIYFDNANDQLVVELVQDFENAGSKSFEVEIDLRGIGRYTLDENEATWEDGHKEGDKINVPDVEITLKGTVGYEKTYLVMKETGDDMDVPADLTTDKKGNTAYGGALEDTLIEVVDSDDAAYANLVQEVGGDVEMNVRVYDGDEFYLGTSTKANTDVLKANADSDADMYFYKWDGAPTFNSTATVYFYEADEDYYVYEIKNGKLTEVGEYDDDEGCWVLKTRTLGEYVVSDTELVNAKGETTEPEVTNPDTGANDVVGIAAALGVVALISGAAVSLKK